MKAFKNLKGSLILALAALIWGLAFVAQSDAADKIPPFLVNGIRSLIGAAALFLLLWWQCARTRQPLFSKDPQTLRKTLVGGIVCGLLITVSCNLQQVGLSLYPNGVASEARAGFLTALYVILVPLISVFMGKRPRLTLVGAILISTGGIYLLCLSGGIDAIYLGDVLIFLCAISFSWHIIAIDHYVDTVGGVRLSMLQFLVCGILSSLLSLFFEGHDVVFSNLLSAAPQLLYLGLGSTGIAYTLQIIAQREGDPTKVSILLSLESLFAVVCSAILLGERMSGQEYVGCALMMVAVIFSQIPEKQKVEEKHAD